jgi:hypothetical protein
MYDDKLNKTSLELMQFGPVLLCFFGYWCMGNMQIFQNDVVALTNQSKPIITDHNSWPSGNQALPLFMLGCAILLGWILVDIFTSCLKKLHIMEEMPEFIVDEKLGSYFECLSVWDRKTWLAQEVHSNQDLGIATMGDWTREQLRVAKTHEKKTLKNAINYEVICNGAYAEKFQFTPIEMCDTPEEMAVSNTILQVLYMGYTLKEHQGFDFKKAIKEKKVKT